ncbi:HAMP domain-containing histidine kinase [Ideonella azotifigens]|uniref:sensor histidine kinase n=1 Tax=Ideonella azotifigens TaxID=513160 RepID=UPI001E41E5FF|nr:HAMP domain-containing sensor histidine kinase [Ideonella azotifigens]MCD2339310.1 HAMP domain-containing histidine kinase [Ideonella azotifigens]
MTRPPPPLPPCADPAREAPPPPVLPAGPLLALLGHELRGPLGVISNAAHLLDRGGEQPRLRADAVALLHRQTARLQALLDELQALGDLCSQAPPSSAPEPRPPPVALAEAVQAVLASLQPLAHPLVLALPAEALLLRVSPGRLALMLGNLLRHALQGATGPARLGASALQGQACIVLQVPAGPGGAEPSLAFDWAGRPAATGLAAGSGVAQRLGLPLVRHLAQAEGGRAEAEAGPQGTCFRLWLPLG